MKKIADKMRLDWLNKQGHDLKRNMFWPKVWTVEPQPIIPGDIQRVLAKGKTPRQAIDAAIRAEQKSQDAKGE